MQKLLRNWIGATAAAATAAAAFAIGMSSCAYDPYYSSSSVSGSYSTGYDGGYGGYGGSGISTSLFISTGDSRWGYDPNTYCYYDYNRRAYYDPYLYGYYPVGYRPTVVYGAPHPYGWRPGYGHIRPPSRVYNTNIRDYRDRESAYRNSNFDWARQVRQRPVEHGRVVDSHPSRSPYDRSGSSYPSSRPSSSGSYIQRQSPNYRTEQPRQSDSRYTPPSRQPQGKTRLPSNYNTPVTSPDRVPSVPDRYRVPSRIEQPRYSEPERSSGRTVMPERSMPQPRYAAPDRAPQQRVAVPERSSRGERSSSGNGRTEDSRDNGVRGYR